MKMDAGTKRKVNQKRQEKRETLGEISELQTLMETQSIEEQEKTQNKIDRLHTKVDILQMELEDLGDTSDELYTQKKRLTVEQEKELIEELIKQYHIGYLVQDNKFIYCLQMANKLFPEVINPQFNTVESTKIIPVLNKMSDKILVTDTEQVKRLFQVTHNDYYNMTGSFNEEKWDQSMVYNKMKIIKEFWIKPTTDTNYNIDFDFLMYCVGGGKQENIEHLEKWLAYKWRYPNRNANIPNVDLGGYPGGNGKGRFIELLKTIFTHGCVVPAALKELTDGFNASWETAVILYYDEPASGELPEGKLKNATGGEEQRIEKKGVDAYTADRNYNMIFTSNNPNGVVKLAGTGSSGEDRRWSVLTTNKVMVDELINLSYTNEEAKVKTNEINNLIKNREEVSKWLSHLLIKYDIENMQILHPLHGEDYNKRFEDQKDTVQLVFDSLMPTLKECGILTLEVLTQAVHELTNNTKLSSQKISSKFSRYLEQSKIKFEYVKKERVVLHFKGDYVETVQKNAFKLPISNTDYVLEYNMFSNRYDKKLLLVDFTIG
jgi:hypothetical protein